MTIQTAMLIKTLHALGADIRWASLQYFLHPGSCGGAAIADMGLAAVFAWKGEKPGRLLVVHRNGPDLAGWLLGPDMIVDDGGDATY